MELLLQNNFYKQEIATFEQNYENNSFFEDSVGNDFSAWKEVIAVMTIHAGKGGYFSQSLTANGLDIMRRPGNCYSSTLGFVLSGDVQGINPGIYGLSLAGNNEVYRDEYSVSINRRLFDSRLKDDGLKSTISDEQRSRYFPIISLTNQDCTDFHFIVPTVFTNNKDDLQIKYSERQQTRGLFQEYKDTTDMIMSKKISYQNPQIFFVPKEYQGKSFRIERDEDRFIFG